MLSSAEQERSRSIATITNQRIAPAASRDHSWRLILTAILWITIGLILLAVAAFTTGCKTQIKGGETKKTEATVRVEVTSPDGYHVVATDDRNLAASTQPSVTTHRQDKIGIGAGDLDDLGSVSLDASAIKERYKRAWFVALILAVCAAGFYAIRNWIGMLLCIAGAVVVAISPLFAVAIAVTAIIALLYLNRKIIAETVWGNQKALNAVRDPGVSADYLKTLMSTEHGATTKRVIAAVKGEA